MISYLVIILFMVLGVAFFVLSANESRVSEVERRATQAFHIAEAGINRVIYDLRQDYVTDATSPSWADGDINGMAIGPDTLSFFTVSYINTSLNGGTYTVTLKNVGGADDIWIRSTGVIGSISQTIEVYAQLYNLSIWDNAIFGGSGASGTMVNGNVDIRGSVHILGNGLASGDYAIDLGGTAELVGNNYNGLDAGLAAKVPALPTTLFNGETVDTLNAELRVKKGLIGLSGSSMVGEADVFGNSVKETIDGAYVTDGYGGNQGAASVHSDNGISEAYDLEDTVSFPLLSDAYTDLGGTSYASYQGYLQANGLVLTSELSSLTPLSNFTYTDGTNSITMDGNGNMTITGIIYIDGGNNFEMRKDNNDKTITYSGSGSILVTGNAQIDVSLVTNGNNSFPQNIMGIMTPNNIGFNLANTDVMGLFYSEGTITAEKQTDIMGTLVSNYFDLGTNVPAVYQVPETVNNLPAGMIAGDDIWLIKIVSWRKI